MFVTSSLPVWMRVALAKICAAFATDPAAPLFDAPQVYLFTAGPAPITPLAVEADFTEATFAGYAAQNLTLGAGTINTPSGECVAKSGTVSFVCSGPATPNAILGYYVLSGADMVIAEAFDTPINILNTGDFVTLDVVLPLSFRPVV